MQGIQAVLDRQARDKRLTFAWWAVTSRFLLHGLVVGTWVSRIPTVQSDLKVGNATLGLCLLGTAAGSLMAVPAAGWLVGRFGSKAVTTWSTVGFCLALAAPSFAVGPGSLFMALVLYGAMAGANDVSINSQAVAMEMALQQSTMSRFHGMFSIGGMIGSGLGGLIAGADVSPRLHFTLAGAAFLLLSAATAPFLLNANDHTARQRNASFGLTRIPPVLIALTAIGFAMFLSEGAIADWGGVYLRQSLQTDAIVAAAGYASFSAGMAIFRLLGDAITERLGAVNTLRVGALSAAAGLGIALASRSPMAALPGFALTGAGFSVIVPLVFGASGRVNEIPRGVAIALVSGSGYIGFLFGPPLIGFVAQLTGLHEALCILIGLSVLAGALANAVRPTSDPTLIRERARLGAAGAPHDQFAVK